jgi:hypothetical protein
MSGAAERAHYHYQSREDRYLTLCGHATLRYNGGVLVNVITVTSDPGAVSCGQCKRHPALVLLNAAAAGPG